jgi:hypothetical protein
MKKLLAAMFAGLLSVAVVGAYAGEGKKDEKKDEMKKDSKKKEAEKK